VTTELVVATGDPQGVGPEVSVAAARALMTRRPDLAIVLAGDRGVLGRAGVDPGWPAVAGASRPGLGLIEVPLPEPLSAEPPSAAGGRAALASLDAALERVGRGGGGRALVTAPLSKEAVRLTSPGFDGHTGYLARRLGAPDPVMVFVAPTFRVALATVHVPLSLVPALVTPERLRRVVATCTADLDRRFGVPRPRIHVLGLNPHAGERGAIGSEELDAIGPAISALREAGHLISGPHPADSYFRPGFERESDLIVAMYHDQGLLPVKCLAFGESVNVTFGLPIVRTSVDHGTAFDLAWGRGAVESRSMECALELAATLLVRERGTSGRQQRTRT
jgi:4-hydroxythreonine-4-phosphate dehydrogenase